MRTSCRALTVAPDVVAVAVAVRVVFNVAVGWLLIVVTLTMASQRVVDLAWMQQMILFMAYLRVGAFSGLLRGHWEVAQR